MILQKLFQKNDSLNMDIETLTALNGDLAVRKIQENMSDFYNFHEEKLQMDQEPIHFDAVIMDLNMPILDGYEACKQIIQIYKDYNQRQLCLKSSEEDKFMLGD